MNTSQHNSPLSSVSAPDLHERLKAQHQFTLQLMEKARTLLNSHPTSPPPSTFHVSKVVHSTPVKPRSSDLPFTSPEAPLPLFTSPSTPSRQPFKELSNVQSRDTLVKGPPPPASLPLAVVPTAAAAPAARAPSPAPKVRSAAAAPAARAPSPAPKVRSAAAAPAARAPSPAPKVRSAAAAPAARAQSILSEAACEYSRLQQHITSAAAEARRNFDEFVTRQKELQDLIALQSAECAQTKNELRAVGMDSSASVTGTTFGSATARVGLCKTAEPAPASAIARTSNLSANTHHGHNGTHLSSTLLMSPHKSTPTIANTPFVSTSTSLAACRRAAQRSAVLAQRTAALKEKDEADIAIASASAEVCTTKQLKAEGVGQLSRLLGQEDAVAALLKAVCLQHNLSEAADVLRALSKTSFIVPTSTDEKSCLVRLPGESSKQFTGRVEALASSVIVSELKRCVPAEFAVAAHRVSTNHTICALSASIALIMSIKDILRESMDSKQSAGRVLSASCTSLRGRSEHSKTNCSAGATNLPLSADMWRLLASKRAEVAILTSRVRELTRLHADEDAAYVEERRLQAELHDTVMRRRDNAISLFALELKCSVLSSIGLACGERSDAVVTPALLEALDTLVIESKDAVYELALHNRDSNSACVQWEDLKDSDCDSDIAAAVTDIVAALYQRLGVPKAASVLSTMSPSPPCKRRSKNRRLTNSMVAKMIDVIDRLKNEDVFTQQPLCRSFCSRGVACEQCSECHVAALCLPFETVIQQIDEEICVVRGDVMRSTDAVLKAKIAVQFSVDRMSPPRGNSGAPSRRTNVTSPSSPDAEPLSPEVVTREDIAAAQSGATRSIEELRKMLVAFGLTPNLNDSHYVHDASVESANESFPDIPQKEDMPTDETPLLQRFSASTCTWPVVFDGSFATGSKFCHAIESTILSAALVIGSSPVLVQQAIDDLAELQQQTQTELNSTRSSAEQKLARLTRTAVHLSGGAEDCVSSDRRSLERVTEVVTPPGISSSGFSQSFTACIAGSVQDRINFATKMLLCHNAARHSSSAHTILSFFEDATRVLRGLVESPSSKCTRRSSIEVLSAILVHVTYSRALGKIAIDDISSSVEAASVRESEVCKRLKHAERRVQSNSYIQDDQGSMQDLASVVNLPARVCDENVSIFAPTDAKVAMNLRAKFSSQAHHLCSTKRQLASLRAAEAKRLKAVAAQRDAAKEALSRIRNKAAGHGIDWSSVTSVANPGIRDSHDAVVDNSTKVCSEPSVVVPPHTAKVCLAHSTPSPPASSLGRGVPLSGGYAEQFARRSPYHQQRPAPSTPSRTSLSQSTLQTDSDVPVAVFTSPLTEMRDAPVTTLSGGRPLPFTSPTGALPVPMSFFSSPETDIPVPVYNTSPVEMTRDPDCPGRESPRKSIASTDHNDLDAVLKLSSDPDGTISLVRELKLLHAPVVMNIEDGKSLKSEARQLLLSLSQDFSRIVLHREGKKVPVCFYRIDNIAHICSCGAARSKRSQCVCTKLCSRQHNHFQICLKDGTDVACRSNDLEVLGKWARCLSTLCQRQSDIPLFRFIAQRL